jgi:hypothetical protein
MDLNVISSNGKEYTLPIETLNYDLVNNEITKNDHPHPLFLMSVSIIVIIVLYMCFISFVKQNFGGTWYVNGNKISVSHNKWNDTFTVNNKYVGYIVGNALYFHSQADQRAGVVYGKKIIWSNGTVWYRPINAL